MLRHLRSLVAGKLDRTKNSVWGRRASILYAFGMWTMLGIFYVTWRRDGMKGLIGSEDAPAQTDLSDEEKAALRREELMKSRLRNEETSLYVAENVYTPLDFMA